MDKTNSPDIDPDLYPDCLTGSFPRHIQPMMARLAASLPRDRENWHFEFKWDGVRALCYWDGSTLSLESRNLKDITARYPELHGLPDSTGGRTWILDGEIVSLDRQGRPSFSLLQRRMHAGPEQALRIYKAMPVNYYVFDILYLDGRTLFEQPYTKRREILEGLELRHRRCRIPPSHPRDGKAVLEAAGKHGLEGIVCKLSSGMYEPGKRSGRWRKVKLLKTQEFIIGGWTPQKETDQRIGSLLLGYYAQDMRLIYAGGTGTGFSDYDHAILRDKLNRIRVGQSPFYRDIPKKEARFVAPKLVVEVEYRRWPEGGYIQQSVYKGLRTDKAAEEVILEKAVEES